MMKITLKPHLGVYFLFAVIIPSFILGYLAIRTVEREEAFLEKRVENALNAEVLHVASRINAIMQEMEKDLDRAIESNRKLSAQQMTRRWRLQSNFIDVPFILSPQRQLLYPDPNDYSLQGSESFLVRWSLGFFQDRESIPIYENVALAYKNEILSESNSISKQPVEYWGKSYKIESQIGDQYVQSQVMQQSSLRKQAYEQVESKGQNIVYRKVNLPPKGGKGIFSKGKGKAAPSLGRTPAQSVFVSESMKFSEIIADNESGIIPRVLDGRLRLFYWEKYKNGYVAGTMIDQDRLVEKIISLLPEVYSSLRILTVLDENGKPIITPYQQKERDWKAPFVAKEISENLPHWEVVAYLTNPQDIVSQANTTALLIWMLIGILMISISIGGFLILRAMFYEMQLAQQKATFAANVSHELKTPLTSISMFTEMLKQRREASEAKRDEYLNIIMSETERLNRLISNVLDFTKIGKKKRRYTLKTINIVELCSQLFEGQRPRLEYKGFEMVFSTTSDTIIVDVDEEAFKQVLLNLISNAEKYSGDTKYIGMQIHEDEEYVLINVIDKGIGIPLKDASKIFEAFYRVDDSLTAKTRGTGLGLTIAKQIVKEHGGEITACPRTPGSRFQIRLSKVRSSS